MSATSVQETWRDTMTTDGDAADSADIRDTGTKRINSPSLVDLAVAAIRQMILSQQLQPGERLIEERLTEELGISRPPLREALRLLQQQGLVETLPRRGTRVVTLTDQDVFEILTLRSALERLAVELGVPVHDPALLARCRKTLEQMERCAREADRAGLVEHAYAFHASIVGLAGQKRLNAIYASVQAQVTLCMIRNLRTREHEHEDLISHVARHRHLLELIEAGDPDAVLAELAVHGERSFLKGVTAARPTLVPSQTEPRP